MHLAFNPETDRPNRVKLTTWKRTGWDPEALPNPLEDLKCEQKLLSLGWEISAFILQDFQVTAAFWWHFEIPLTRHNRIVGLSDTASSCSVESSFTKRAEDDGEVAHRICEAKSPTRSTRSDWHARPTRFAH